LKDDISEIDQLFGNMHEPDVKDMEVQGNHIISRAEDIPAILKIEEMTGKLHTSINHDNSIMARKVSIDSVIQQNAKDLQNIRKLYYETVPKNQPDNKKQFTPHKTMPKFSKYDRLMKSNVMHVKYRIQKQFTISRPFHGVRFQRSFNR